MASGRGWPRDAAVIVTGGASGIGRALATVLARDGAHVLLADQDGDAAAQAARAIGARASSAPLDVRDREGFVELVDRFVADHGRIDVLVSCAGVSVGGVSHLLPGEHWDLALDVNLRGTVNGLLAAYPHMIRAGRGHLVNVASGVGLAPSPFVAPYAASKFGVVGLSLSLRPEAALHGVRVSVLCPGSVDTPILDRRPPADLPAIEGPVVTGREYLAVLGQRPMPADRFAAAAVRRLRRGRAIVVVPRSVHALWLLQRISPGAVQAVLRPIARRVDRRLLRGRS